MKISILIKALNEEMHIAQAIESSLKALEGLDGEVILADSCSTDATVSIAQQYPIKIVRFLRAEDRSCGAGAQLAFQHSIGDYVYILDGDMCLKPDFIATASKYLDENPGVFGVGGLINDVLHSNLEFKARVARQISQITAGPVFSLDCGGLYRREAVLQAGFFANKNLHSYEELDLAIRLRKLGGILVRLPIVSVDHFTHNVGSYELLWRRVSSGYARGAGELLRAGYSGNYLRQVITDLPILKVFLFLIGWMLAVVVLAISATGTLTWGLVGLVISAPFLGMALRRRSMHGGFFAVISWFTYCFGIANGFFGSRSDPKQIIESVVLK